MKIMVLGSTGALGTALEIATKNRAEYKGFSHKDFDITNSKDLERLIYANNPDVVVNAVALIGINICEKEAQKAFDINAISVSNLAKLCERQSIVLVQPSSHAVFDGKKEDYYTEDDFPNPTNVYGVSKLAAELFAQNLSKKHYVLRFPTLFGPRRNSNLGFVDKVLAGIKEGKELKIADDKIDSPTYTLDAANRLLDILEKKYSFGVYHVANDGKVSYYDFANEIARFYGLEGKILRAKDSDFPTLAPKPLKTSIKSIKLTPMREWKEALKDYLLRTLEYIQL